MSARDICSECGGMFSIGNHSECEVMHVWYAATYNKLLEVPKEHQLYVELVIKSLEIDGFETGMIYIGEL